MGLGSVSDITLQQAREAASEARKKVKESIGPIEARKDERDPRAKERAEKKAKAVTFEQAARLYYDKNSAKWKNAKHAQQFLNTMRDYVYPVFGKTIVGEIDKKLVEQVLEPIWLSKNQTASRVRGRIKRGSTFASSRGGTQVIIQLHGVAISNTPWRLRVTLSKLNTLPRCPTIRCRTLLRSCASGVA